jgi:hypothetical protein
MDILLSSFIEHQIWEELTAVHDIISDELEFNVWDQLTEGFNDES